MPKFRKKPVEVEAIQFTGHNGKEILEWMKPASDVFLTPHPKDISKHVIIIETLEGAMRAFPGDWVIKGVNGEFYPCKPFIFEKTYDAVGEETKGRATIAVDFDGVIHRYSKGWHDGTAYDEPMDGAEQALKSLMTRYNVFILSTRQPEQIQDWMARHMQIPTQIITGDKPFWNVGGVIGITNRKLAAIAYIDDRAVQFSSWEKVNLKEQE